MEILELKSELEKRERQLKNADPEQIGFLKKKIERLKSEIADYEASQIISEPEKPEKPDKSKKQINETKIIVSGKELKFNKSGVAKLPYGSLVKMVSQNHYIVMYQSNTGKDAEIILNPDTGNWDISCCEDVTWPVFEIGDIGLAISYLIDFMHEKYSADNQEKSDYSAENDSIADNLTIDAEEVEKQINRSKKRKKQIEVNPHEDIDELKRYLGWLYEWHEDAKNSVAKKRLSD